MTDCLVGWELLYQSAKSSIRKKEDILFLLIHHSLLKAEFKCAGKSENWSETDTVSELLPEGWNTDAEFILRYKLKDDKYTLLSTHADSKVIVFNLVDSDKLRITNLIYNFDDTVKSLEGDILTIVPQHKDVLNDITEKLITPMIVRQQNNAETQTTKEDRNDDSSPLRCLRHPTQQERRFPPDIIDPIDIGRRDLDPLAAMGVGGGGMLFELPRRRIGHFAPDGVPLPRGAVPPGARFDPFGPPDVVEPRRFPRMDDMFS